MATRIDYGLTPNDINALAAVIATELGLKGKGLGEKPIDARGKQNYYSQLEADAILDAMVLRQMISQGSNKLGSMKYNTLANVAMAPLQFSGLNEFSKSLYGNPDLTEDEYLAAIRSGLGGDISDELFNRAVANVNSYFKRRKEAGGNAIGPFKDNPNTHFINARIGDMAKTQDAWTDGSLRLMTPGENNFGEWILPKGFVMPNGEPLEEATLWYPSHNFLYNTRYNPRPKDLNPLVTDPDTGKLAAYTNFDTGWLSDKGKRIIASPYNYSLIGTEAVIPPSSIATDASNTNKVLQELKSSEAQQPYQSWLDPRGLGPDNWAVPPALPAESISGMLSGLANSPAPASFKPGITAPSMTQDSMVLPEFNKESSLIERLSDNFINRFNRTARGYNEYSTGTPDVPPLYEMHGSDWGPQHQALLEKAISSSMERFGGPGKASNEDILNSIPDSIITDIRAQVKYNQDQAGKANTPVDPYAINTMPTKIKTYPDQQMSSLDRRYVPSDDIAMGKFTENTDTVPAMLTEGEAVIPAEAAQLKRNRAEIQRMVDEGREIQDDKEKLGISAFDSSYDEALAKLKKEDFRTKEEKLLQGTLPEAYNPKSKYDVGFKKRFGEWWEGVGEGAKSIFYPFGPGGLSNPTVKEEEVQPKQTSTPPDYFEMENLLNKQAPPPMQGPVKPEAIPQQYINDASDYTPEQKENQNKIVESLPSEGEPSSVPQQYINDASNLVLEDQQKGGYQFKDVTNWIEENLGFNKQDVFRGLLYYVGGRLSGGSHAGSLRWAGRQVIQESGARNTAVAKAQATAQGNLLDALTDEAKQKLKDGYFTRAGSKAINAAIRSGNYTKLNTLLADTENSSLYNQMAMISDLSKRKPYFIKDTNFNNHMYMAPHKSENVFVWQDPNTKEIFKIPMDEVEEYKKDVDYDNMFNKFKNQYEGYEAKGDSKNENSNLNKLKRHYNADDASTYRTKIKNIAEKYNKSPEAVWDMVTRLLEITPDSTSKEDLNVDLEAAIGSLIVQPDMMPDHHKLKDFNQKDINKAIDDFGGDPGVVTVNMQKVDQYLAGDPTKNRPQKLVKDIKHEEVDAEINNSNLDNKLKTKIKAIRNPYWKMVYLEFYTSRG